VSGGMAGFFQGLRAPAAKRPGSEIQSHTALRGIAAMSVFLGHVGGQAKNGILTDWGLDVRWFSLFNWGYQAVLLFFMLSGFILNWVYLGTGRPIVWSSYLRARVARIMPLYYLTLIPFLTPLSFYAIWGHKPDILTGNHQVTLLANLGMVSGILFGWRETLNSPAWSIGIEFFCYLFVFPLLVLLVKKSEDRWGFGILATLLAGFATWLMANYHLPPVNLGGFEWQSRFLAKGILGFVAGFLLCSVFRKAPLFIMRFPLIDSVLTGTAIIFLLTRQGRLPDQCLLYAFPALILFTAYDTGIIPGILKHSIFQWLGERSYSIYLWHILVMGWFVYLIQLGREHISASLFGHGVVNLSMIVLLVLAFSDISYRYFEMPCRDWIRKRRERIGGWEG
jgi:peptidoglycan/LPS O-acetylase OafA/YrhL